MLARVGSYFGCVSLSSITEAVWSRISRNEVTGLDPKLETLKIGTNCSERRFGWQSEYSVWSFAAPLPSGF